MKKLHQRETVSTLSKFINGSLCVWGGGGGGGGGGAEYLLMGRDRTLNYFILYLEYFCPYLESDI